MDIRTGKEARKIGERYYFTGNPCKHGHISRRIADNGGCLECVLLRNKKWRESEHGTNYLRIYCNNYRKVKAKEPEYQAKRTAHQVRRECNKLNATPAWADLKAIEKFYIQAKNREQDFGIKYHVDHVVPLLGDTVCGLHVEYNLQLLPAVDNIKKGNKLWDQLN